MAFPEVSTQAEFRGNSLDKTLGGGDPVFTIHRGAKFWRIAAANGKVLLPDATKYDRTGGVILVVLNTAAATYDIKDNADGVTVVSTLAQDQAAVFYLADISTAAGKWHAMVLDNADGTATPLPVELVFVGGVPNPDETHTFNDATRAWTAETDALGDRKQASGARGAADEMFMLGTFEPVGDRSKTDRYTVSTDTWLNRADKPTAGYRTAAASLNVSGTDVVYVYGGTVSDTDADAYNTVTDVWSSVADIPNESFHGSATFLPIADTIPELVVLFGGGVDPAIAGDFTQTMDVNLSPPSVWVQRTKIPPPPRGGHDCGTVNGKAYLVAGKTNGGGAIDDVNQYDLATDAFIQRSKLVAGGRYDGMVVVGNDRLYYAGGEVGGPVRYDDVSEYLEVLDSWISVTDLPAVKSEWANQGG